MTLNTVGGWILPDYSGIGRVRMPYQEIIPVSSNDSYRMLNVNLD
jgi:hypothetical protein